MSSDLAPVASAQSDAPTMEPAATEKPDQSQDVAPTVNGDRDTHDTVAGDKTLPASDDAAATTNLQNFTENAEISARETTLDPKESSAPAADPNPKGPSPVHDVAEGIQPLADFIPKDAANLSHPTPPPDELLISGDADVDVEMANAQDKSPLAPRPDAAPAQPEQGVVRPREEDYDGEEDPEPVAKRSKIDDDVLPDFDAPTTNQTNDADSPNAMDDAPAEPAPAVSAPVNHEPTVEADAKPVTSPPAPAPSADAAPSDTVSMPDAAQPTSDAPHAPGGVNGTAEASKNATPSTNAAPQPVDADSKSAQSESTKATGAKYYTEPMTTPQKNYLLDKLKNTKKTKHATFFLKPVDIVALNIPSYPDIIKHPMDLGTMETKLKDDKYGSLQDFADDFALIINNTTRFNGETHAVTVAGGNLKSYVDKWLGTCPSPHVQLVAKSQKKRSPSVPRDKRREPRAAAAPPAPAPAPAAPSQAAPSQAAAAAAAAGGPEPFALQSDGTPQIRRQSTNRPARAIKPPQNREIQYAKPKRKEHQMELRFCEYAIEEIRSSKYGTLNHVFQMPVDPVALNIPHYRQVIKHPMDLSTMHQKLKNGQYGKAAEFKADFETMIKNCVTFNPTGNPVRDMGVQLGREFEALWQTKDKWERKNMPASRGASDASDDDEDAVEDEDASDDDAGGDAKSQTIRDLQKQLAAMQNAIAGLGTDKPAKANKKAAGKTGAGTGKASGNKKSSGPRGRSPTSKPHKAAAAHKPAGKPQKARQVTYEEKQEISEAVNVMDETQVARLTEIITQNCQKYRDMEDMELEIDDLPNDVQLMLLDYVRKLFGRPGGKKAGRGSAARDVSPDDAAALDDDDFEPAADRGSRGGRGGRGGGNGGAAGKRKKHKPMGRQEQQDTIESIQRQLATFNGAAGAGGAGGGAAGVAMDGGGAQPDTSGDEESEESEEE